MSYASVGAQSGEIRQLPDPPSAQANELTEAGKIANLRDLVHMAFDIGFEVIGECLPRIEFLIVNPRIAAGVKDVIDQFASSRLAPFSQCERQQAKQCGPPSEGLANGIGQAELVATGEDEEAVPARIVSEDLQV